MSPFQIIYGTHPRGVYELRNMGKKEMRSSGVEYFVVNIQEMQENVKQKLQERSQK
jgi:hypothetical protein